MSINFHLPDFFLHHKLNKILIDCYKNYSEWFHDDTQISSIYGTFPNAIWNGGKYQVVIYSPVEVKNILSTFTSLKMPLKFTFTNNLLEEIHLKDKFCNDILKLADNGLNEVIVASDILEQYIRDNYPNYKINSSAVKCINTLDELNAELDKDYKSVCLNSNWNNKFDELEKIEKKDKCEILLGSVCKANCPRKTIHYRSEAEEQLAYAHHVSIPANKKKPYIHTEYPCDCLKNLLIDQRNSATFIKYEDVYEKLIPMGFTDFKFEGRNRSNLELLENYIYYMVKPEYKDKARFIILSSLTSEYKYFF